MAKELYERVDERIFAAMEGLDSAETEALEILAVDRAVNAEHSAGPNCPVDGEPRPCSVVRTLAEKYLLDVG
jgi:hypothetical protein